MSITIATPAEDPHTEHWLRWQRVYAKDNRRAAIRARIAFAVVLTGTAVWLGLQILSSPAWP